MSKNVCITRLQNLLRDSSFTNVKKEEIMNSVKQAMAERRLTRIDKINVDEIAKDAASKIKAQKIIDRANALNDEIIARKEIEFILDNYKGVEQEGLLALLVGSSEIRAGARNSVANLQDTVQANLINSFKQKLRKAGLEKLFTDADLPTQKRIVQVMDEAGAQQTDIEKRAGIKPPITETNSDIKKIGILLEEHSEAIRTMLNDRGANIPKLWGWVVKHSHDQFNVRNAAETLGIKIDEIEAAVNRKGKDKNYNKNYKMISDLTNSNPNIFLHSELNIRKKNKLPAEVYSVDFELEYGKATIEVHKDSLNENDSVLIIDDLIATGGTAEAAAKLVKISKSKVAAFIFVINLFDLGGSDNLLKSNYKVENLINFPGH